MRSLEKLPAWLLASGYQKSPTQNLWVRVGESEKFSYTDGAETEKNILEILKGVSDLSVDSLELAANISDWPTEYHFSARRANLLRPISELFQGRVLEIGAGCGAISRFAGEFGAEVIALEGSHARARIAAERCRDLPNVNVVCDRFDLFTVEERFDTILLIGVLEYARIFSPGDQGDPVQWMLESAKKLLAPEGCLIVAIENKLGLKYFAGCSEDHIGVPFYGVEGLYQAKEAVTFGRKELTQRFSVAGLTTQKLLLPFPDYKIPEIILDADACEQSGFDTASFLGLSAGRDYAGPAPLAFSQALAWQALADNGVVPDLSNSFLFVCSAGADAKNRASSPDRVLAWSYSTQRRCELLTNTRIAENGDSFVVCKEKRYPQLALQVATASKWSHRIVPRVRYMLGERLDVALLRAAASNDIDEFFRIAQGWLELLKNKSVASSEKDLKSIGSWLCAGDALDLIPRNIIINTDGLLSVFDQEWVTESPISLGWILVRGVLSFATNVVNGSWICSESVITLSQKLARQISLELYEEDLPEIQRMDVAFLNWVRGEYWLNQGWDLGLVTTPIGMLNLSMVKLANAGAETGEGYSEVLRHLEARLDAECIAHTRLIGKYQSLESLNNDLEVELNSTRERLGLESSALRRDLVLSQNKVSELSKMLVLRENSIKELGEAFTTMRGDLLSSESRNSHLEQNNQALSERLKALETHAQEVEGVLTSSETSWRELKKIFEDEQQKSTALENTVLELERQLYVMNAEVLSLNAERATFGARVGRGLTGIRTRLAPVGTRRGRAITLFNRFAGALASEGLGNALARTRKFAVSNYRAWHSSRDMQARSQRGGPGHQGTNHADHPEFSAWIAANEPDHASLEKQRQLAGEFEYKPLISIIIPVYKVPRDVLSDTLASLEEQTYGDWQACIVWSDIDDLEGWSDLQQRVATDKRFTVRLLEENGGISLNSDAALELVAGEFVALLDHDDTLTPWALFDVVLRLQSESDLDFIYSDKDGITADGSMRLNALFKPDWSPEMLHSVNYLTHLNVMRTSILREIGGWRRETDGAQDWDLFFRITERTNKIAHLPSIHYHWRILPTSTATGLQAKPYAAQGQLRAQQDHFRRRGLPATVIPSPEGMFNIRWPVVPASVEVVVFQSGHLKQLVQVLDVLRAGQLSAVAKIHVCHSEPLTSALRAFESVWGDQITFIHMPDTNWRSALAHRLPSISSKTLILIDGAAAGLSDTLVDELSGWVAHHPEIAWASAIALHRDGTVFEAGRVMASDGTTAPLFAGSPLFSFGWFGGPLWYRNVSACSPYALALSADDLQQELEYSPEIASSRDLFALLCAGMRRNGKRGLINPFARVYFAEAPESHWENDARLYANDPHFNPSFVGVSPLQLH